MCEIFNNILIDKDSLEEMRKLQSMSDLKDYLSVDYS